MNKTHLRLVTDNSSSSVKGRAFSLASRKRRRCQLSGISPLVIQLDTADCLRPISRARAEGPPKRPTISRTKSLFPLYISKDDISYPDMVQAENIDIGKKRASSQNVIMFPETNRIDEKRDIKAAIMARVENVRSDLGENPTEFAKRMGLTYKDYWGAVDRQAIDMAYLVKLAMTLDLSLDYLCCLIDEPAPIQRQPQFADYWSRKAASEGSKARTENTA